MSEQVKALSKLCLQRCMKNISIINFCPQLDKGGFQSQTFVANAIRWVVWCYHHAEMLMEICLKSEANDCEGSVSRFNAIVTAADQL